MHDCNAPIFYSGLSVEWYDYFFPELDEQELAYYAQEIATAPGSALEIACGTGRLLLPLLERGYAVEGFDNSTEMLQLCKQKAHNNNLKPLVYHQSMQQLRLNKTYGCLYSPLGSFQHLHNQKHAMQALHHFYEHLMPGGKLVIYLYLPWYNALTFGQWHQHDPVVHGDKTLIVHEKMIHDPIEQQVFATYQYRLYKSDQQVHEERKEITLRWYSRYEFQLMLEHVGFTQIKVTAGYNDNGPFDTMLFSASRAL